MRCVLRLFSLLHVDVQLFWTFVEKTVFSPLTCLCSSVRDDRPRLRGSRSGLPVLSLDVSVCPVTNTTLS